MIPLLFASAVIAWTPVPNASGYLVYQSAGPTFRPLSSLRSFVKQSSIEVFPKTLDFIRVTALVSGQEGFPSAPLRYDPAAPYVFISPGTSGCVLRWSAAFPGYSVQRAIPGVSDWDSIGSGILQGNSYTFSIPAVLPGEFFRLKK